MVTEGTRRVPLRLKSSSVMTAARRGRLAATVAEDPDSSGAVTVVRAFAAPTDKKGLSHKSHQVCLNDAAGWLRQGVHGTCHTDESRYPVLELLKTKVFRLDSGFRRNDMLKEILIERGNGVTRKQHGILGK